MSALTAIETKLRGISPELEAVVSVLQVAQSVTGLGGAAAESGLKILDSALKALEAGASGALTHEQMMAEIQAQHAALASSRAAEDSMLGAAGGAVP